MNWRYEFTIILLNVWYVWFLFKVSMMGDFGIIA